MELNLIVVPGSGGGDISSFTWSSYWARGLSVDELNSLTCDPDDTDLGYEDFVFSDPGNAAVEISCTSFNSSFPGSLGK